MTTPTLPPADRADSLEQRVAAFATWERAREALMALIDGPRQMSIPPQYYDDDLVISAMLARGQAAEAELVTVREQRDRALKVDAETAAGILGFRDYATMQAVIAAGQAAEQERDAARAEAAALLAVLREMRQYTIPDVAWAMKRSLRLLPADLRARLAQEGER